MEDHRRIRQCGSHAARALTRLFEQGPLLLLVLLGVLCLGSPLQPASAQLAFTIPSTCTAERFDISSLSCQACPANSGVSSSDSERCRCNAGYAGSGALADTYALVCSDCVALGMVANQDRTACMNCSTTQGAVFDATVRECVCPTGYVLAERDLGGSLFADGKRCVRCSNTTRAFPAVDPYVCRACPDPLMSMLADGTCTCQAPDWTAVTYGESSTCVWTTSLNSISASYSPVNAQVMQYNDVRSVDGASSYSKSPGINSILLNTYFLAAITKCWVQQERHACQLLANMCVLQKYHQSSTACLAFRTRQTVITTYEHGFTSLIGGQDGWRTSMPFLYQSTGTITSSAQLLQQKVTLTNKRTDDNSLTGTLSFKLFSWSFNGTFLGSESLGSQLQLCSGDAKLLSNFLRFGTNYENSCQLDLSPFLSLPYTETIFYELFVEDVAGTLYPCPIKVINLRMGDGSTPNRNDGGDERVDSSVNQLTRRFYLVDNLSGKESFGSAPVLLSYAQRMTLRVEMQGSSSEYIRPPLLVIEYGEREASDIRDGAGKQFSTVEFSTIYLNDSASFWRAAHGLFGTAIALAVFVAARRIWVWQRKTGTEVLEVTISMFVRFIIYLFSAVGDLFFIMLCCLTFYCWLFYKGQQTVYYLLPVRDGSEVDNLRSFAIVTFLAKLCDVLEKIWAQIHTDVFFIDWEKPKGFVDAVGSQEEEAGAPPPSVSVWRKLFASNKWNDLQSARLVNVPFTLFFMIFLMEPSGLGLKYLASAQPSPSNLESTAAPLHPILLYAVCTFFLLCICYLQLLFHRQITHRYFKDEVAQFVDLLCTSNISCLLLDERQHGWYIHGKTVHPYADVSLEEMNAAILAEEKHLTRPRGLDVSGVSTAAAAAAGAAHTGRTDTKDAFELYTTHAWRATYDDIYTRLLHKQSVHAARAARSAQRTHMDLASEVELGRRGLGRGSGGSAAAGLDSGALDSDQLISSTLIKASSALNAWLVSFINREPQFPFPYDHAQQDLGRRILGLPVALPPNAPCTLFDDTNYNFTTTLPCGIEPDLILFLVQLYALCNILFDSILVATLVCFIVDRVLMAFRAHWGQSNIAKKTLLDERFLI